MQRYILRRLMLAGFSLFGLTVLVFIFLRVVPGDAAVLVLGDSTSASPEQVDALREELGLTRPLPVQYIDWLGGIVTGDLGRSLFTGRSVVYEVQSRISATVELALLSLSVALVMGVTAGTYSAVRQGTAGDQVARFASIVGLAVPSFWLGTMLLALSARWFGWNPPVGQVDIWSDPWTNLQQFFLPSLVLGLALASSLSRMTRSAVLEVLREDYIRTARAKGLSGLSVLWHHTLRTALIPVITLFGVQVGAVIGGSVIIENIFSIPGLGRLMLDSVSRKDYPTVQGIVLLYGTFILLTNLTVDIMYGILDPRVRYS